MRAVLQRVSRARVSVDGKVTGEIAAGLMILLGVGKQEFQRHRCFACGKSRQPPHLRKIRNRK